jgi:hypothetical protein
MESEALVDQANELLIKSSQEDDGEAIVKYSKQLSLNEKKIEELFFELEELSEKLSLIESEYETKLNDLN